MENLALERHNLEKEVASIMLHSRGSLGWEDAWNLSPQHRHLLVKQIEDINKRQSSSM